MGKKKKREPVCMEPNCKVDRHADRGKFQWVFRYGRPRIVLKRLTPTLAFCPKCGFSYPSNDFRNPAGQENIRTKQKANRIQALHALYGNR